MKNYISNVFIGFAGMAMAAGLAGCSAEMPFDSEGEGKVYLHALVNNITTRAQGDAADDSYDYEGNCVVYISRTDSKEGQNGLVYKKRGLENLDPVITLRAGEYAAEAWSGDSVAASFTKKYFRGYHPFQVTKGQENNEVINCKIQNVLVSVNVSNEELQKMIGDDFKVTVTNNNHEDGSLVFDKDNFATAKGYFMMAPGDNDLQYVISGTKKDGKPIEQKVRTIKNVERAHHYILKLSYIPPQEDDYGQFDTSSITITIEDEKVEDSKEEDKDLLPTEPTITGIGFSEDGSLSLADESAIPEDVAIMVCSIGDLDLKSAEMTIDAGNGINLLSTSLPEGIQWTAREYDSSTNVSTSFILLSKAFISSLSSGPHTIKIDVTDANGRPATQNLTLSLGSE